MVGGPLAQVHQQVADRPALDRTVGLLETAAQAFVERCFPIALGPAAQLHQIQLRLGPEAWQRRQGLASAQQFGPLGLPLGGAGPQPALPPQTLDVATGEGPSLTVAPAEKGLGPLQPEPAGSALGRRVAVANQIREGRQRKGLAFAIAGGFPQQQPSRGELAGRWGVGEKLIQLQTPGGLAKGAGWIRIRITPGDAIETAQGMAGGTALGAEAQIATAAADGQKDAQLGPPLFQNTHQITGLGGAAR